MSYPRWTCHDCAMSAGGKAPEMATFHFGKCGVCKKKGAVTEPRDYGRPNFKRLPTRPKGEIGE